MQEIGDFIAHRDQREKGMITQTGRDVFTSFDVWSMPMRKHKLELADFIRAAEANLRLSSDDLIRQALASSRQTAATRLKRTIAKLKGDQPLPDSALDTIAAHARTRLARMDHQAVFTALETTPAPTERLRNAFTRFSETVAAGE